MASGIVKRILPCAERLARIASPKWVFEQVSMPITHNRQRDQDEVYDSILAFLAAR